MKTSLEILPLNPGISHRDISLENVLLSGGDVRLMDFGQAVQTHLETGLQHSLSDERKGLLAVFPS